MMRDALLANVRDLDDIGISMVSERISDDGVNAHLSRLAKLTGIDAYRDTKITRQQGKNKLRKRANPNIRFERKYYP